MNDPDQSVPDQLPPHTPLPDSASADPTPPSPASIDRRLHQLAESLARQLDPDEVAEALTRLQPAEAPLRSMIAGLGLLLAERSVKATSEYLRQAPLLIDRLAEAEWGPWVGVGMKIAARSAVTAVRYFRESPSLFADIESIDLRRLVLECADRCADRDAGLSLELLRQAPAVIRVLPPEVPLERSDDPAGAQADWVRRWAELGERLAEQDSILASEYFKHSPLLLLHLPASSLHVWAELGGTLVQPNQLGKPDYLPALEYFRVSPEWVGAVTPPELRPQLLRLVRAMTDETPDRRVQLLKQVPQWLQNVSSLPHRSWLLEQAGMLVGERPAAAIALLSNGGELVRRFILRTPHAGMTGAGFADHQEWRRRMEDWVAHGRLLLTRSPEAGLAYFRLESSAAEQYLDHAAGGLSLRQVARTLMLFAEGLSGYAVSIRPIQGGPSDGADEADEATARLPAQLPYREERTIFLPPFVSEFGSPEENFRYYRVMTAYQAAQLEFGAFVIGPEAVREVARSFFGSGRSAGPEKAPSASEALPGSPGTVEELFTRFSAPVLADDLWKIAEGGRIDACLRRAYPGLRSDLDLVVGYTLFLRPSIGSTDAGAVAAGRSGPSTAEQVVELLLQLSMAGRTKEPVPPGLESLLYELGGLLQQVQREGATAADALRVACECCLILTQRCTGEMEHAAAPESASAEPSGNPLGQAGAPIARGDPWDYRSVSEPQYRGRQGGQRGPSAAVPLSKGQSPPVSTTPSLPDRSSNDRPARHQPGSAPVGGGVTEAVGEGDSDTSPEAEPFRVHGPITPGDGVRAGAEAGLFAYPEWDESIQDYRPGWCTVHERVMETTNEPSETDRAAAAFADQILADYRGQLSLLRKMFERLRPDRFKKLKRREAGEEIDLDAAIEAAIDRRVGRTPSDKLYIQRDRRERDVAVALLVDVSGSTGQVLDRLGPRSLQPGQTESTVRAPIELSGRSIIQIERESVLLLAEAVSAVGDALAVYAYSGDGRDQVDVYLVKEFDEPYGRRIGERIGAMKALVQNRDGTAIRHATRKLLRREAKTRLLLWLSDGRPFDRDYEGAHALADTRQALREARRARVRTFCITVDRRGEDYQAALFTPGHYAVIDDVRQLPERLPRIYQRVTT
jgi:nitric oxide reductase NorD protein